MQESSEKVLLERFVCNICQRYISTKNLIGMTNMGKLLKVMSLDAGAMVITKNLTLSHSKLRGKLLPLTYCPYCVK